MNETVTLTKIKIGMQKIIDERLLHDAKFDIQKYIADEWTAQLRGYLLGEDLQRYEISYPADWWQAFKQRWFPTWAKRRWPVKMRVEVVDAKILYSEYHNKVSLKNEPHFVDLSRWSYLDEEPYSG